MSKPTTGSNPEVRIAVVGSRAMEIPRFIKDKKEFYQICIKLAQAGVILRSGGAEGADQVAQAAFYSEYLAGRVNPDQFEIYLPWSGFCCKAFGSKFNKFVPISQKAKDIACEIHHKGKALATGLESHLVLHARNVYQVLGEDLNTPVQAVFCWTETGLASGGTATAMNLAASRGIPVINLARDGFERSLSKLEGIINANK